MEPHNLADRYGATSMTESDFDRRIPCSTSNLPTRPPRVAQSPYALPSSSRHIADVGYPVLNEKHAQSHHQSHQQGNGVRSPSLVQGRSVSSTGGTSVMTGQTADTIESEKAALEQQSRQSESRRSSRTGKRRQEMAERNQDLYAPARRSGSGTILPYDRESARSDFEEEEELIEQRRMLESKALNILLFLSAPCAALSFLLCAYSIFASLFIFVFAPIRLCTKPRVSLWEQLLSTLTSAQRLQLRCIYAPTTRSEGKSVASLVCNLLISPFLSMGIAVAAWTVAIYWIFAAIIGDPDGTEGGNDGRSTVLGLRKWWESWLFKAIVT